MRSFAVFLLGLLSIVDLAWSQVTDVPSAQTADLPMYRPILLSKGSNSLIDRIDTQDLIRKGQKDAQITFICSVKKTGEVEWSGVYTGTPDSDLLRQELQKRLSPVSDPRFMPAIYNHRPVDAIYYGTVTFAVVDGKPRLRIFSNQEAEELKNEHDFIGPQPFFGPESKFAGFHYPNESTPVVVDGVLYALVRNTGLAQIAWSADRGATWEWADWKFTTGFGCPTFVNFGSNYAGARDGYVYVISHDADSAYQVAERFVLARVPKGRLGEPEDLAGPLLFLASRASDFYTGHILYADGGYTAG